MYLFVSYITESNIDFHSKKGRGKLCSFLQIGVFFSRITYKEVFNFFPKQFATRAIENETPNEDGISGYLK